VPLDPAYKAGLAGHVPVSDSPKTFGLGKKVNIHTFEYGF
jgi:hypothetical protein